MLSPVKLLPTRENLAALNVLAFLSAWSNPAAVNLLVLPPTICRASPKKPFYRVSVHVPRANALALYHTVDVHDCNVPKQQQFDAEPSFICKKNVFGGMLLDYTCLCCSGWALSHRLILHSKSSPRSAAIRAVLQASHSSDLEDDSSRDVTIFFREMRHVGQKYNPLLRERIRHKTLHIKINHGVLIQDLTG